MDYRAWKLGDGTETDGYKHGGVFDTIFAVSVIGI